MDRSSQLIISCLRCVRLRDWCAEVARTKRRAYRDETYWGRPVPPFGTKSPRLMVIGLAPGAHGANRTGRIFTGDSSGNWLYRALHQYGFANQPDSVHRKDGLRLSETLVTCVVRCAPPQNRPNRGELDRCRPFLVEELRRASRLRVVLVLGRIAFDSFLKAWQGEPFEQRPRFAHGAECKGPKVTLLCSYHPSRQNTQTGRLTRRMFHAVFRRARTLVETTSPPSPGSWG
ncbi:MAG: uracil-DNA glycosylase [Planctomycetota bacterium]